MFAPPAAHGLLAVPTHSLPPAAPANISSARPIPPLATTPAATPQNPHTESPAPATAKAGLAKTPHTTHEIPSAIFPSTTRPLRCDASYTTTPARSDLTSPASSSPAARLSDQ